jgi:beta-glucosidase
MKFKHKIDKFVSTLSERISSGGVSQLEVKAEGERDIFGNMPALARKAAAEGIVLLKNNNALPYKLNTKISVFGRCQLDYFYVGYGSGGDVNAPYFVNVIDGIKNAGGHVNEWLLEYYKDFTKNNPAPHGFWGHWPMNFEEPSLDDKMIERASEESDVALVVIGRAAGEDRENTLTKGSYYLTDEERTLLDNVCNHFSNVTVLLDCGNIIDMQWALDYEERLRGIIYAWQGGMESGNAIADVLFGRVNPSGRLTDTVAVRYEDYPSAMHFGNKLFNTYVEDIFVGYRYFETFSKEKALFPFGYGLSYTNFDIEVLDFKADNDKIKVEVRVTNIGDVAGKEVVELYASAPQGKLSKPVMSLVAFDKTINLEPKESQKITLEVPVYLLASFDDTGATGHKYSYILEKGEYKFFIGENVRDVDEAGSFELKEDRVLEELEAVCAPKEYMDRIVAFKVNGSFIPKKVALKPEKPYLRKRILDNLPKEIGHVVHNYNFSQVKSGEINVEKFVSSLTNQELEALTRGEGGMDSNYGVTGNAGAFGGIIPELNKKGVPAVITTDGPAGIRIRKYTSLLPCGTALASTFNTRLVEELCSEMGKELKNAGSNVLLAPGMNIHRNPLCGRNFEYFSEDPLLTGKMAAAFVRGIQSSGGSACPKHFACNNQESSRTINNSIVSQRALREIYLKGFEICVKEAKPLNIMTSYNKINGVWSHYNYDLATTVLRKEWGFDGCVMTDWWMKHSQSHEFPNLRDNAYRVRSQVDVYMPGSFKRTEKKYKPDNSLLETIGLKNGITRGELERSAINVLNMILKLEY